MRIYAGVDAAALRQLVQARTLSTPRVAPDSDDEQDEYDALMTAVEDGPVVVAADVESVDDPIGLADIASLHVDVDGSGELAWFATQELEQVIALLES